MASQVTDVVGHHRTNPERRELLGTHRSGSCAGKRHISWWIGCSLSSLPRNGNEPLGGLWRNENRTVAVTHFHQAVQIDV